MNVIDLLQELGIQTKRTAATNGGEFHSPCPDPNCNGENRFCIWPKEGPNGRYWCRQCHRSGDAIQFCRDFMNMDFFTACEKVGRTILKKTNYFKTSPKPRFTTKTTQEPQEQWRQKAEEFINKCHTYLYNNPDVLNLEKDRGLHLQTILKFKLGWNPFTTFEHRSSWGLLGNDICSQSLCLPQGIVIPSLPNGKIIRVKIRRHKWSPNEKYPKYHIVAGSASCLSIYGDYQKPIIIIEAELDALLVQQFAENMCCCIALGGVSNRPDQTSHEILSKAPVILFALDFDEAGKKAYTFWKTTYPHLIPWPVPKGKSPGDAYMLGINLRQWVYSGLQNNI